MPKKAGAKTDPRKKREGRAKAKPEAEPVAPSKKGEDAKRVSGTSRSARWVRLQIPYGEGATEMGGILGYRGLPAGGGSEEAVKSVQDVNRMMNELMPQLGALGVGGGLGELSRIHLLHVEGCRTVSEVFDRLSAAAAEKNVALDRATVAVFPLDSRHQLAWVVKEEAEKRGCSFERHIPGDALPEEGIDPAVEPKRPPDEAAVRMNGLCQEAMEAAQGGEFGEAMSSLREALGLAVTHFGWGHHYTGHMARYLAQVLRATGNEDNRAEASLFLRRACSALEGETPTGNASLASCLGMLAEEAGADDETMATRLRSLAERVG